MATALLCAAISGCGRLPSDSGQFRLYGHGNSSCGDYLAADRDNPNLHMMELDWVAGYLSAVGYYKVQGWTLRDADYEAVSAWVGNYCRENPLKSVPEASAALVLELAKPK
jgi:hypothetical protein